MTADQKYDIFLRAHTVVVDKPKLVKKKGRLRASKKHVKWPQHALVFDCESRTDTRQELTFGFYRILELKEGAYELVEEGAFFDDHLSARERAILEAYVNIADTEVTSFPPKFPLHSRSEFVKRVFY